MERISNLIHYLGKKKKTSLLWQKTFKSLHNTVFKKYHASVTISKFLCNFNMIIDLRPEKQAFRNMTCLASSFLKAFRVYFYVNLQRNLSTRIHMGKKRRTKSGKFRMHVIES